MTKSGTAGNTGGLNHNEQKGKEQRSRFLEKQVSAGRSKNAGKVIGSEDSPNRFRRSPGGAIG